MFSINSPFASKEIPGGSLFTRVHGIAPALIAANTEHEFSFTVPYTHAKLTCVEIIEDASAISNLTVNHPLAGELNQFGFDVNIGKNVYKRESAYDADLFQGLILKIKVKNETAESKKFGVNIILHEVKA